MKIRKINSSHYLCIRTYSLMWHNTRGSVVNDCPFLNDLDQSNLPGCRRYRYSLESNEVRERSIARGNLLKSYVQSRGRVAQIVIFKGSV